MKIKETKVLIKDLYDGYQNTVDFNENGIQEPDDGLVAYGGKLIVRPPYQREFIYKDKQRDAVIDTVKGGFPLNTIYWAKNGDNFELMDGQQRTISICEYIKGSYSIDYRYFHNLINEEKEQILNYELSVYICEGTDKEKLDWFKIINIAGEKLTNQELRNAIYNGAWVTDAKRTFSKRNCPICETAKKYLKGSSIRQDYLETVIKWISEDNIEDYMANYQHKENADELVNYYKEVINWVETKFGKYYRKEMKGVEWGYLFNKHKELYIDPDKTEVTVQKLMIDEDVTNKQGIYSYIFTKDESDLSIRTFTEQQKREVYEKQKGICPITHQHYEFEAMEADHIIPWSQGGKTVVDNCQMVEKIANRKKYNK
jgi:glutaredoxin